MKADHRVQIDRIVLSGFDEGLLGRVRLGHELEKGIAKLLSGPAEGRYHLETGPDASFGIFARMVAGAIQEHAGLRGGGGAR